MARVVNLFSCSNNAYNLSRDNSSCWRKVILTEAFDEGLMVLRRLMGWDMIDMTYSRMMETKLGQQRWDGKELKNVPHFEDLPQWVSE